MSAVADILRARLDADPEDIVAAAAAAGLPLRVLAAVLTKESRGRNVFGHDPVPTGGTYEKGATVTEQSYRAYRAWRRRGTGRLQGVGPMQLTYHAFQDQADAAGGCWIPRVNLRVGALEVARCVRAGRGSLRDAGALYNGGKLYASASTAARAYGRDLTDTADAWGAVLDAHTADPPAQVPEPIRRTLELTDPRMRGDDVGVLQTVLGRWYPSERLVVDDVFGPHCDRVVRRLQVAARLPVHGRADADVRRVLGIR